jgi:hypothetical protein
VGATDDPSDILEIYNQPTTNEELIETWDNLLPRSENLHVVVISADGWDWAIAWLQSGISEVHCKPLNALAEQQLKSLMDCAMFGVSLVPVVAIEPTTTGSLNKITIYCTHIHSLTSLEAFACSFDFITAKTKHQHIMTTVSVGGNGHLCKQVQHALKEGFVWQSLRHVTLGGLTSARLLIGWKGCSSKIYPGTIKYPRRPLDRFLETTVRNYNWRRIDETRNDCWRPQGKDGKPYPWPWPRGPQWVEAYSVFMGTTIEREFTTKEICQLYDLRCGWATILPLIISWNDGFSPPLRLFIEFILCIRRAMRNKDDIEMNKGEAENLKKQNDWGRVRAPWLGGKDGGSTQNNLERLLYFGWIWNSADYADISVACRGDDAEVNLKLWAVGGDNPDAEKARSCLRNFLWQRWCFNVCREARIWLRERNQEDCDFEKNRIAIRDCVERCVGSDWWNWDNGSRLLFWRWPPLWRGEARDGAPGFHYKTPRPQLRFGQVPIQEEWIIDKDREKLEKLLRRKYIDVGVCRTTVPRFPVPKGENDIRVVWDLSKNGLNETMYTPSFFLATMSTYLRRIEAGFYGGDFDIGEQFHNYMLHESEQVFCGVEVPAVLRSKFIKEGWSIPKYMRWTRLVFGWQSSPYMALRMFARALEFAKGDPNDTNNAFHWDDIVLNLPGMKDYDPGRPRVMKLTHGILSADLVTFYDDGRVFGSTEEAAHQAIRQITSRLQYLGNQDAARKRRAVSQRPGAWAGGVAYSDQNLLRKFISQVKWDKTKQFLAWVWECLEINGGQLERTKFCSGKGFLVHVSLCYDFMLPYMKGFHLSENLWRANRDQDGWKEKLPEEIECSLDYLHEDELDDLSLGSIQEINAVPSLNDPPSMVKAAPRLKEDVRILRMFFDPPSPVQVLVRPVQGSSFVAYGGGDASGEGFGGEMLPLGMKPLLRRGFWCKADAENSSNWRELRNLIDVIKIGVKQGNLVGREVWLATDNSTAANAYYKGTSASKRLHEMITELRLLTLEGNFVLHIYHIAGTRMIQSGIDGLSRGDLHLTALEKSIQVLMPLHLSPTQRSPSLKNWLRSWLDADFSICSPKDWFHVAQQAGQWDTSIVSVTWVWDLPPAAAIHAIEELGVARLKRHNILRGVVLVPMLLHNEWFRRFIKTVDVYFTIPSGSIPEWPKEMHEPLTVGLYLPLFRHQPWDWKRVPFMVPFGSAMSTMHKESDSLTRDILRKFWNSSTRVAALPKRLVCDMLQNASWRRFLSISPDR